MAENVALRFGSPTFLQIVWRERRRFLSTFPLLIGGLLWFPLILFSSSLVAKQSPAKAAAISLWILSSNMLIAPLSDGFGSNDSANSEIVSSFPCTRLSASAFKVD